MNRKEAYIEAKRQMAQDLVDSGLFDDFVMALFIILIVWAVLTYLNHFGS